ncbi:MAG: ATP-binding cassette domain-containing protein [Cyanobacteria bacterium K_Offshore_surface_m2_239]|nr:ATP-binding cassette domain-containing protein [Cyanobacteria bacterium K_Offshore_surface_m2_239]
MASPWRGPTLQPTGGGTGSDVWPMYRKPFSRLIPRSRPTSPSVFPWTRSIHAEWPGPPLWPRPWTSSPPCPKGSTTVIGERGVRLSGGLRQRLGRARALYKRAEVMVLDEATGALDTLTEQVFIDALWRVGRCLTLLLVAHRISTLSRCDQVLTLEHGRITACGTYQDLLDENETFRLLAQPTATGALPLGEVSA